MYLHLGQDVVVHTKDIVGIFDLDTASLSAHTRDYLARAQSNRQVTEVSYDLPKSFIITAKPQGNVYISPISSATLLKRSEAAECFNLE